MKVKIYRVMGNWEWGIGHCQKIFEMNDAQFLKFFLCVSASLREALISIIYIKALKKAKAR
jgi:hypothetical protein